MSLSEVKATPRFLDCPDPIFTVTFSSNSRCRGNIVYLPPFEEEMNRCRAAVAGQARRFAATGYSCTLIDYYGTGESSGRLDEADAQVWAENIRSTVAQLQQDNGAPVALWGCRLGGLLAMQHLGDEALGISTCLLWQPVTSGKTYLNQFFRQRAAAFVAQGLPGENTAAMRERLLAGDTVEVAGYPITEKLVSSIECLDFADLGPLSGKRVIWMENLTDPSASLGPRSVKAITQLESSGAAVEAITFVGSALWQLHERANCPDLIDKTPLEIL